MDIDISRKAWRWRSQTWIIFVTGLAVILVALVASYAFSMFKPTVDVKVGQSGVFRLWVADTDAELYQGLSGVDTLSRDGGLLMDFKVSGYHGIVMRDMKIPLDIVWLSESKKVVYIVKNASPELGESKTFAPTKETARYVLELPAGTVTDSAIKVGDIAEFDAVGGKI
ncbi:DUF192 domain-containing protein [Candidatus Saccharibacteria bacterium TM7i]|nr:DUF192 domain-containing protein [Candidatus Saccharibacteria bacterium TM7i]